MKSANAVGLVQAITSAILILLLVYQQADCVGLLHHQKTARLTTYGNHNMPSKQNSTAQPKQTFSGKECKSDTECAGVANTTCKMHPEDNKMHCLCSDKKSPQNGACPKPKQDVGGKCNEDDDCIRIAQCKTNSTTKSKTCVCMEEYVEEDGKCSSSPLTRVPSTQAVFLLLFYPFLQLIQ